MAQYIQSTPGTLAAAMGYQSQVPQSQYSTGQLGLAGGGLASLSRVDRGWGSDAWKSVKKRVKKLIPKEAAPLMMAAAPFMGQYAGPIMAGLGSYKTYGKIDPRVMAMSMAPHLTFGGTGGIGYGNAGVGDASSLRNILTGGGVGTRGAGEGVLRGFGTKLDASIFGSKPSYDTENVIEHMGKKGLFGTGGEKIGLEDVFKTLTTKDGKRDLKKIEMVLAASASYADALERAKDLGMGEGDLPFSNQDEYMAAKARLQGDIPTKPLIAHGGRVGYGLGSWLKRKLGMGQQKGTAVADPNVAPSGNLRDNLLNVFANKYQRQAIPLSGVEPPAGSPISLRGKTVPINQDNSFMGSLIPRAVEGGILSTPQGPENGLQEEYQVYIAGGGDLEFEDWVLTRQQAAHGGRIGNAQGGIPNTRTGLQWGSDKGEGLGGEEVEADMRYEGGFMPYGEEPKADDVPARLSKDEFVFTDQAVAGAGDGDIDLGAERLYNVMKSLEQGGRLSEESEGIAAQEMEAMI